MRFLCANKPSGRRADSIYAWYTICVLSDFPNALSSIRGVGGAGLMPISCAHKFAASWICGRISPARMKLSARSMQGNLRTRTHSVRKRVVARYFCISKEKKTERADVRIWILYIYNRRWVKLPIEIIYKITQRRMFLVVKWYWVNLTIELVNYKLLSH